MVGEVNAKCSIHCLQGKLHAHVELSPGNIDGGTAFAIAEAPYRVHTYDAHDDIRVIVAWQTHTAVLTWTNAPPRISMGLPLPLLCVAILTTGIAVTTAGTEDTVITIHKIEEDSRLLVRIGAFQLPILVSTLLSGFTLVLFDVAETALAQRLAIVSFGLETSASTVLCLIAYRGQQLYSHATDITPLARKFLHRMLPITIFALVAFALGVILFVFAFVVEASDSLGSSWMTIIALAFFPTVIAGVLFAASTVQVRRHSIPPGPE